MAYTITTPADVTAAISDIASFLATELGWSTSVDSGTGAATIDIPGKAASFELSRDTYNYSNGGTGYYSYEVFTISVSGVVTPWSADTNWLNPLTRLYLHAGDDPEPWCLVTFESAPGYYHHAFFGYADKLGTWSGGAVADGTLWAHPSRVPLHAWDYRDNHLPLSGGGWYGRAGGSKKRSGAVEVAHPDAAFGRYFFSYRGTPEDAFAGGGWQDAYNNLLAWNDATAVDGSLNLHPVLLFAKLAGGMNAFTTPLGSAPGIRMINMQSFNAGDIVAIGGEDWQIFPLCTVKTGYTEPAPDPQQAPGLIQPADDGDQRLNFAAGTERLAVAVLHKE